MLTGADGDTAMHGGRTIALLLHIRHASAGVGFARTPPVTLQPGDTVRLEITGLGVLESTVKDA